MNYNDNTVYKSPKYKKETGEHSLHCVMFKNVHCMTKLYHWTAWTWIFCALFDQTIILTVCYASVLTECYHVCPPMCACVHAHAHMCVCRRACLSTCMCVYFPRLSSGANWRWEDGVRHRGDGYRCGGGKPSAGSRGVKPQQRSDWSGRHCQDSWAEPLREQGKSSQVYACYVISPPDLSSCLVSTLLLTNKM